MNDDLDALIRAHFARPEIAAQTMAEYAAIRRHAERPPEPPPATTIPMPEFVKSRFAGAGIARYRCPRRCGWHHDEPTDQGPLPLILPGTPGGATEMISLNAEVRALAYRARVEAAIEGHYAEAH